MRTCSFLVMASAMVAGCIDGVDLGDVKTDAGSDKTDAGGSAPLDAGAHAASDAGPGPAADAAMNPPDGAIGAETLATGLSTPRHMALDANFVYVTTYGNRQVLRVPVGGGALSAIASDQNLPSGVAVNGTDVYWTNEGGTAADGGKVSGAVMKVAIGGGTPVVVAAGVQWPHDIGLDSGHVYWVNEGGPQGPSTAGLWRAGLDGASPVQLTQMPGAAESGHVRLTTTAAFYVAHHWTGIQLAIRSSLVGAPLAGGAATELWSTIDTTDVGDLAIDTTSIYWTNNISGSVSKIPLGGGALVTLVPPLVNQNAYSTGIVVDDQFVYWAVCHSLVNTCAIQKMPIGGGAIQVLAAGEKGQVFNLALDAQHVYWTTPDSVRRVAK